MVAAKRLKNHKDICDAISLIFIVHYLRLTWSAGNANFLDELFVCFVNTNNRVQRVIWSLVDVKDIFHPGYIFCTTEINFE